VRAPPLSVSSEAFRLVVAVIVTAATGMTTAAAMRNGMSTAIVVIAAATNFAARVAAASIGIAVDCDWAPGASAIFGMSAACIAPAGDIVASASSDEAMRAPAVAIAPVRPWANAEEDAVIEVARTVKAAGCALIGRVLIVAVGAGWRDADIDGDLRVACRREGYAGEQGYGAG